jgi:hypothetical protein
VLPALAGRPIRVEVCTSLGPHLAAASIPGRLIRLDAEVLVQPGEFERILVHEIFHFVWVRLGNGRRRGWESLLVREISRGLGGELGWSAEWRKARLKPADPSSRTPAWRRYVCESFCDTAAWLHAGISRHPEFTLPAPARRLRRRWLAQELAATPLSI